jgi:DNA-binding NarL/FixJ family response regulator
MEFFAEYPPGTFTDNELEIIQLICEQHFDSEIAKKLSINVRTVHVIRKCIMSKMNVTRSAGIVIYAVKHNIYQL